MDARRAAVWGLWVFTLGNFAWVVRNLANGAVVDALTDIVIVAGGATAAASFGRALDGIGPGWFRSGLWIVAAAGIVQHVVSLSGGLELPDGLTHFVVLAGSFGLAWGAFLWEDDGWNLRAAPWIAAGLLGLGLEPFYFLVLHSLPDPWQSGYLPGILLVSAGAFLAAWAFRPNASHPTPAA